MAARLAPVGKEAARVALPRFQAEAATAAKEAEPTVAWWSGGRRCACLLPHANARSVNALTELESGQTPDSFADPAVQRRLALVPELHD